MASGPEDSLVDDTSSSLGDSTYDFLDDKSGFTTDDEDHGNLTQSISSSNAQESEVPAVHQSQDTARPVRLRQCTVQIDQCQDAATEGDLGTADYEHLDIKLDEPSCFNINNMRSVEGSHTLRIFDKMEVKELISIIGTQAPLCQLKATIKQSMASHTLPLQGPFGMLYVGESEAKDIIVQKIGSALTASSKSSGSGLENPGSPRFNVVPISSFGDARSPEVLLVDSLGIEIKVDHCNSATFVSKDDGNDSITLRLSNDTSLTSAWSSHESKYVISTDCQNWEVPKIAIFYLSDTESMAMKQTQRFARSFLTRHKVPCLVITQSQVWQREVEAINLDYLTPHLSLESIGSDNARPRVIKCLPIDLATFLNIDAVQVNRNLACLADVRTSGETHQHGISGWNDAATIHDLVADETGCCSTSPVESKSPLWFSAIIDRMRLLARSPVPISMLLVLSLSCFIFSHYLTYPQSDIPVFQSIHLQDADQPKSTITSKVAGPQPTIALGLPSVSSLSIPLSATKADTRSKTDLASLLLDSHSFTPNNSVDFKVHVVGDCHVVLRPPHWFMRYRKAPKLIFNISRKDQSVKHELSILFDGVYALKIPREDAFGILDVSVRTTSKPKLNETFQVDFGNSWLSAVSWKATARTLANTLRADVKKMQTGLTTMVNYTDIEVQKVTHQITRSMNHIQKGLERFKSASVHQSSLTRDLVLAQARSLSQTITIKLSTQSAILVQKLALQAGQLKHHVNQYIRSGAAGLACTARAWFHTASSMGFEEIANGVSQLQHEHFRSTQKGALKAWWKLVGLPKQTSGCSSAQGSQCKRTSKAGRH